MNQKGTWPQALSSFLLPILAIVTLRWALVEPYVIPSGSMIPNLLINDHIFVQKFSYGLRLPFSDQWLVRWAGPKPGDVIVFRYPKDPEVFYIKRLIAGPGAHVKVTQGAVEVDGKAWKIESSNFAKAEDDTFHYFTESSETVPAHTVRFMNERGEPNHDGEWTVPEGMYFFMGDNRDQSSDGRVWGFVSEKSLIGKAWVIWLSCDEMLESAKFVCNPSTIRWSRLFHTLEPQ